MGHVEALLHRRARGDGGIPALDVRVVVQVDALPLEGIAPRPGRDVGDRVVAGDVLVVGEALVEHAVEAFGLVGVSIFGIGRLARIEVQEVVRLADTLVLISEGRVAASGAVEDIMGRLDLGPLTGRYEAGAVLTPTVAGQAPEHHLTRLDLLGHDMYVPQIHMEQGQRVRLRVRARDVSIALKRPQGTSVLNILPATVSEVEADLAGAHVELALRVTPASSENGRAQTVLARVTRKSLTDLALAPGKPVFALVKAVAIDRHSLGGHGLGAKRNIPADG